MKLVEGEAETEGRVEVCINKRWGTICRDTRWSDEDATTVCRQLGYWEGISNSDSIFDECLITAVIMILLKYRIHQYQF